MKIERVDSRILVIKIVMNQRLAHFVSLYAPQTGRSEAEKDVFWNKVTTVLATFPGGDEIFVGGDLNGHVGWRPDGYQGVHGGHGFGERNDDGNRILD